MESVKVSARSVPKAVAGAIAAIIREGKTVEVQAVGAGAVNQAVKAIATRQQHLLLRSDRGGIEKYVEKKSRFESSTKH